MKKWVIVVAGAVLCAVSFLVGRCSVADNYETGRDTVTVYKTVTVTEPAPQKTTDVGFRPYAFFSDTVTTEVPVIIHDTLYLPITQRFYNELDGRLRIWVSGYDPKLDKYELDEVTKTVTSTTRKHWGFSIGVGPAVIYTPFHDRHIDAGIGIFGGVTYTF